MASNSNAPHHLPHPPIKFTFKGSVPSPDAPLPPAAPAPTVGDNSLPASHSATALTWSNDVTPDESGADDGMSSMGVTEDDAAMDLKPGSNSSEAEDSAEDDDEQDELDEDDGGPAPTAGEPTSYARSSSSTSSGSPPPSTSYPVRTHSLSTLKPAPSPLSALAVDLTCEAPLAATPGLEAPILEGFFKDDDTIHVTFPPVSPFDLLNKNAVASTSSLLHAPVDLSQIPIPMRFSLPHKYIPFNPATSFVRPHDPNGGYEPPVEDYGYFASPEQLQVEKERAAEVAKEREERRKQREEELVSMIGWKRVPTKGGKKTVTENTNGVVAKGWTGVSNLVPVTEEKDVKKWKNHTRFRKALTSTLYQERTTSPNGLPTPDPTYGEDSPFVDLDSHIPIICKTYVDTQIPVLPVPPIVKRFARGVDPSAATQNGNKRARTVTEETIASKLPQRKRKKTEKFINRDSEEASSAGEEIVAPPPKRLGRPPKKTVPVVEPPPAPLSAPTPIPASAPTSTVPLTPAPAPALVAKPVAKAIVKAAPLPVPKSVAKPVPKALPIHKVPAAKVVPAVRSTAAAASMRATPTPPPPTIPSVLLPSGGFVPADKDIKFTREDSAMEIMQPASPSPAYDENVVPVGYQLQHTSCLSKKSKGQVLCHQCTSRRPGRGCSFQGRRFFPVDEKGNLVGQPVFRDTTIPDDLIRFEHSFNTPFTKEDADEVRSLLAPHLLLLAREELAHSKNAIKAPLDLAEVTSCDTCLQTLSGSFMCKRCGREACFKCMESLKVLESQSQKLVDIGAGVKKISNAIWHSEYQRRRRRCVQARGRGRQDSSTQGQNHTSSDFLSLSRFRLSDLERLVEVTSEWIKTKSPKPTAPLPMETTRRLIYAVHSSISAQHLAHELTRPILYFPPTIDDNTFLRAWSMSEPIMIDAFVYTDRFAAFTPTYVSDRIKDQSCELLNLFTFESVTSATTSFFSLFGEKKDTAIGYKLSEWPLPTEDFSTTFPEIVSAFHELLPSPKITRKDGVYNMASHTPVGSLAPNVGPHLMASWASGENAAFIPLKLVSHMIWSAGNPKFRAACWDIFRKEDTERIRTYVAEMITNSSNRTTVANYLAEHDDPLLGGMHYLNPLERTKIYRFKNVRPYRIWQRVGELIFVPAGCVYQVCTFEDTMSIHSHIMSAQHIEQTVKVHRLARQQTKEKALWRTDPQQLRTQMFFTWMSCEEQDSTNDAKK